MHKIFFVIFEAIVKFVLSGSYIKGTVWSYFYLITVL